MKYIIFASICVIFGSPSQGQSALKRDLDELAALVPQKEIKKLTEGYAIHDLQFWKLAIYIKGPHFKALWVDVLNQTGVKSFVDFGENNGVDIVEHINEVADKLNLPEYPEPTRKWTKQRRLKYRKGGLAGYLREVEALLPLKDLKQKYDEKYGQNATFKDFFDLLDFDQIYSYFGESPGSDFVTYLQKYKVDWHEYFNKSRAFFEEPTSRLVEVLLL